MALEIENLRQLSAKRNTFDSLAQKRERQHEQLGELLGQGSITKDVRIAEVMERTLDRWGKVTERAESLGQAVSEETERVDTQLQRLRDLGSTNPTVHAVYKPYQAEFDAFRSGQAVTVAAPAQETEPAPPAPIEPRKRGVAKEPSTKGRDYAIQIPDGSEFTTRSRGLHTLLPRLFESGVSISDLAVLYGGEDTGQNRNAVRSVLHSTDARDFEHEAGYEIINTGKRGTGGIYSAVAKEQPADTQVPSGEPEQPETAAAGISTPPQLEETERGSVVNIYGRRNESTDVEMSNGQVISVSGRFGPEVLKAINGGLSSIEDLAKRLYGESNPVTRTRVSAGIAGLNKKLSGFGFEVRNLTPRGESNRGVPARYVVKSIQPQEKPTELSTKFRDVSPDVFNRPTTTVTSQTTLGLADVVEVPYEPRPDEIRTPEQTRILIAITSALTKSQIIYFDDLQRALGTEERIRTVDGQIEYRPYKADELKIQFESGLRKLREESAGANLRENWTEDDLRTWETTQGLVYRNTEGNNFEEYLRRVKKQIDIAARAFRETHGDTPEWLKLKNGVHYEPR